MAKEKIKITNKLGLHARAAAKLSHLANSFTSNVYLQFNGDRVSAKSLLGILTLAASVGSDVIIEADGKDENEAVKQIKELFDRKFDEES